MNGNADKKGLKRKGMDETITVPAASSREVIRGLLAIIKDDDVKALSEGRQAARRAAHQLADFGKKGE